jgi:tetratricopeptide (TPR) repeat protein
VSAVALVAAAVPARLGAARDVRWVEARTPHFAIVSDAGEQQAREVALEFERLRALVRRVAPDPERDPRGPVLVFAASGERTLRQLVPQFWERDGQRPAAVSWKGVHAYYIVLRTNVRVPDRRRLFFHEYIHLLVRNRAPRVPAWLDEGLADFWSTLAAVPGGLEAGAPPPQHLRTLARARSWVPLAAFLAREAPGSRRRRDLAAYYAQSWALAHYMMLGKLATGRGDTPLSLVPDAYVSALREGRSPTDAADMFGGVTSLEQAVIAYVRSGEIRSRRARIAGVETAGTGEREAEVAVRTLSPASALAARACVLIEGQRPMAALPLLEQALAIEPAAPDALEARGYFHFVRNEPSAAAVWFDKALATGASSYLAHYYRAVLLGSAMRPVAEDDLRRAIDLNPAFAPAYSRLAEISIQAGRPADALPLLERAVALEPEDAAARALLERLRKELGPASR